MKAASSSPVKCSKIVFPLWNFVQSLKLHYKNNFYHWKQCHECKYQWMSCIIVMKDIQMDSAFFLNKIKAAYLKWSSVYNDNGPSPWIFTKWSPQVWRKGILDESRDSFFMILNICCKFSYLWYRHSTSQNNMIQVIALRILALTKTE